METSLGAITVNVAAGLVTVPEVAVIPAVPTALPVASPLLLFSGYGRIVTTPGDIVR